MLNIEFTVPSNLAYLDERLKTAIAAKLTELTTLLFDKVQENLNGKILQKKTGQLSDSMRKNVDTSTEVMVGVVFPDPASPKAWALEKGGIGYYPITPSKASVLSWIGKSGARVFAASVNHPPSKAFHYMEDALEEMRELVPAGFEEAIQSVLDGRV
jgi:hypothetical protein